jgi:hypothetical protein
MCALGTCACPTKGGEQAAAKRPCPAPLLTLSSEAELVSWPGKCISTSFYLVRKSMSFQWSTSKQFLFSQQITGWWEGKEIEGKREDEQFLFLRLC